MYVCVCICVCESVCVYMCINVCVDLCCYQGTMLAFESIVEALHCQLLQAGTTPKLTSEAQDTVILHVCWLLFLSISTSRSHYSLKDSLGGDILQCLSNGIN